MISRYSLQIAMHLGFYFSLILFGKIIVFIIQLKSVADPGFPVGGGRQFTGANRANYDAHLSSFLPYFI